MYILKICSNLAHLENLASDRKRERDLMIPSPLHDLHILSLIWEANKSFASSIKP